MAKKVMYALLALLFSFLLWLPVDACAADTTTAQAPQTVTMQRSQYETLRLIIEQQELRLTMLQDRLQTLKQHSTGQMQDLTELQTQLGASRTALQQTRQSLTSATASLQTATEALQRQEQSLQTLTGQIKSMEHKLAVLKRQRDTWAVLAGVLAGCVIYDNIK
jgi:chromosome segregation ATPase